KAREIIDCRGTPTVEVDVWVDDVLRGRADVPSGRSVGSYEACELRDGESRHDGFGVLQAVGNVNEVIAPAVIGTDVTQQRKLDSLMIELDGTPNKSKLGANAILGVSLAAARAAASTLDIPLYKYIDTNAHVLPVPMMNLINGGKLSSNDLDFQEFIMMPVGAETFSQALQITTEVNSKLRALLAKRYGKLAINVGDEGGCVPPITSVREALDVLQEAVRQTAWQDTIVYALDVAATHLYDKNTRKYTIEGKQLSSDDVIDLFKDLVSRYPIVSIEDPLDEDDFEGFARITRELGIQIVGDDLFVTNSQRLKKGIEMGAANALLWKVNQIGTLSEALDSAAMAFKNGYGVVVSERSGETEDSIIADLVVALNAGQIKTGAPVRSERTGKYNQLLRTEEELGNSARYAGRDFRRPA
ncbi:MAG: phosphopyruvate hydratase, partial [Dehalococcoidia bacterium]|nr:phosphopyruvate hydratase [Dehalococcoidia bacterium]